MIRFIFRLVGYVLIALGFAMLVIDGTTSIASGSLSLTSIGEALAGFAPSLLTGAQTLVETRLDPSVWPLIGQVLGAIPAFAALMLAGLVSTALGRRPRPPIGFAPLR